MLTHPMLSKTKTATVAFLFYGIGCWDLIFLRCAHRKKHAGQVAQASRSRGDCGHCLCFPYYHEADSNVCLMSFIHRIHCYANMLRCKSRLTVAVTGCTECNTIAVRHVAKCNLTLRLEIWNSVRLYSIESASKTAINCNSKHSQISLYVLLWYAMLW